MSFEKSAVSKGRLRINQSRKGRRPISVENYLKKEKNGTLYKKAFLELRDQADEELRRGAGVGLTDLRNSRILATFGDKAAEGLKDMTGSAPSELAKQIFEQHQSKTSGSSKKPKSSDVPDSGLSGMNSSPGVERYPEIRSLDSAGKVASAPEVFSPDEIYYMDEEEFGKFAEAFTQHVEGYDGVKLAAPVEELYKEALLAGIGKAIKNLGGKKAVQVGGDTIPMNPSLLSRLNPSKAYKNVGAELERSGKMLRGPKGLSPQQAKSMGFKTSPASRIAGESMQSAGHHMGHASGFSKAVNPVGHPVGGAIEGAVRGAGRELRRKGKQLSMQGKVRRGKGLQAVGSQAKRQAGRAGKAGELLTGAGVATALAPMSPAAAGIGAGAKALGVYAPAKATIGAFGTNLVKDVAADAAERGANVAGKKFRGLIPRRAA